MHIHTCTYVHNYTYMYVHVRMYIYTYVYILYVRTYVQCACSNVQVITCCTCTCTYVILLVFKSFLSWSRKVLSRKLKSYSSHMTWSHTHCHASRAPPAAAAAASTNPLRRPKLRGPEESRGSSSGTHRVALKRITPKTRVKRHKPCQKAPQGARGR